jgi:AcrR family transcriptional regulator
MRSGSMSARSSQTAGRKPTETRQLSRQDWVDYGARLLGESGADAVRIERLCAGLNVTKGSFYWHFKSRADFLDQMLMHWQHKETQAIIDEIEAQAGSPADAVKRLFEKANAGTVKFRAELAVRQWAIQDNKVAQTVQAVDERRLDFLHRQFQAMGFSVPETRMRARLLYSLILGEALIQSPEPRSQRRARWLASLHFLTTMGDSESE